MERIQAALQKARQQRVAPKRSELPVPSVEAITHAFSLWENLKPVDINLEQARKNHVVTLAQSDPYSVTFDLMRTKLSRTLQQSKWTCVGITSPTPKCGKTAVSVNLAFSLSRQKDRRIVLADLDLRQPRVGKVLGIRNENAMEQLLTGECPIEDVFRCYGGNLAIGCGNRTVPHSAELLQSAETSVAIKNLKKELAPDCLLIDLPPMLLRDDVMAFLPNLDCIMLVAASEMSTASEIDTCLRELADQTNVLGVVLNKCRYYTKEYGYY
jgi:Mrp family chromosome partitioning ATPase